MLSTISHILNKLDPPSFLRRMYALLRTEWDLVILF